MTFQLTRSRGAWLWIRLNKHLWDRFQLTRSRGAWPCRNVWRSCYEKYFNSHAHVERDVHLILVCFVIDISTHTLTWSVTQFFSLWLSTLPFQLTRSRGAWQGLNWIWVQWQLFQLTRSRGAWRDEVSFVPSEKNFNSHAHVERDTCWAT